MGDEVNIDEMKTQYESQIAVLDKANKELNEQIVKAQAEIGKLQAYVAKYACSKDSEPVQSPIDQPKTFSEAYAKLLNDMRNKQ